jgi:putative ABC transport system ATP-binding protein
VDLQRTEVAGREMLKLVRSHAMPCHGWNGTPTSGSYPPDNRSPELVQPIIETHDLFKEYPIGGASVLALRGVSLRIDPGEFVAIMGPSGSGKSTLMNLFGCLDVPTFGVYRFEGVDVSRLGQLELARLRNSKIGFIFQNFNLLPRLSALENVELPLVYAGVRRKQRRERARELLSLLGLDDRKHHKPCQLSGGQQQRVAIARALANRPALILADEPTGALDSESSSGILDVLQNFSQQGMTLVLITHEPHIAGYAGRSVALRDGTIVLDGQLPTARVS